jgi:hypothetical protein
MIDRLGMPVGRKNVLKVPALRTLQKLQRGDHPASIAQVGPIIPEPVSIAAYLSGIKDYGLTYERADDVEVVFSNSRTPVVLHWDIFQDIGWWGMWKQLLQCTNMSHQTQQ